MDRERRKMEQHLKEKLETLPEQPGVYLLQNAEGKVLYIGKAVNLRNRVRQYFTGAPSGPRIRNMMTEVSDLDFVLCRDEREAFLLECSLIKSHMPRYNVLLKDDKTYPYLKITVGEAFPRLCVVRRAEHDGARYFGPFPKNFQVKRTLRLLQSAFRIRTCSTGIAAGSRKPCLNYQLGLCSSPCSGACTEEEYAGNVRDLVRFLQGRDEDLIQRTVLQMEKESADLHYEKAAILRDRVRHLRNLSHVALIRPSEDAVDVLAIHQEGDSGAGFLFHVRQGKGIGQKRFSWNQLHTAAPEETARQFLIEYYAGDSDVPGEILLCNPQENTEWLEEWFLETRGKRVSIPSSLKGHRKELAAMAAGNARAGFLRMRESRSKDLSVLGELADLLGMEVVPRQLEAYDVSHMSGKEPVAAMSLFLDGKPHGPGYRRFRIRSGKVASDTHALEEVLNRRLKRHGDKGFGNLPDLILVDGGVHQAAAARRAIRKAGQDIPVWGMVKDEHHRTRGLVGEDGEIALAPHPQIFRLVALIQEETHRAAVTYHRKRKRDGFFENALDDIPGLGKTRKWLLLLHFGTLKEIRAAGIVQLEAVKGIGGKTAERIHRHFHGKEP